MLFRSLEGQGRDIGAQVELLTNHSGAFFVGRGHGLGNARGLGSAPEHKGTRSLISQLKILLATTKTQYSQINTKREAGQNR